MLCGEGFCNFWEAECSSDIEAYALEKSGLLKHASNALVVLHRIERIILQHLDVQGADISVEHSKEPFSCLC